MAQINGTSASETLEGGDATDLIKGFGGNDTINCWSGGDTIYGGAGNDVVTVGDGAHRGGNRVYGGGGDDLLYSGSNGDRIYGGAGEDRLYLGFTRMFLDNVLLDGGDGDDWFYVGDYTSGTLAGGAGADEMVVNRRQGGAVTVRETGGDWVITQAADNWFVFADQVLTVGSVERLHFAGSWFGDDVISGAGDDVLHLSDGANRADAGAGNDLVSYAATGANTLHGGAGDDTLIAALRNVPSFVVEADGTVRDGLFSVLTGFEHFIVIGTAQADTVSMRDGHDIVEGYRGNDTILGDYGDDTLIGGPGYDSLVGGVGRDLLRGGGEADLLFGQHGDDDLRGGRGNDTQYGGLGNDTLYGGANDDHLEGEAGDDLVIGGNGNDLLLGVGGNDTLRGGEGDDLLAGGAGRDRLTGGAGADTFRFDTATDGPDRITDFVSGQDRIAVSRDITGTALRAGVIDTGDLTYGSPGDSRPQFVLDASGPDGPSWLFWDADGAGANHAPVLLAILDGPPQLVAEDIVII